MANEEEDVKALEALAQSRCQHLTLRHADLRHPSVVQLLVANRYLTSLTIDAQGSYVLEDDSIGESFKNDALLSELLHSKTLKKIKAVRLWVGRRAQFAIGQSSITSFECSRFPDYDYISAMLKNKNLTHLGLFHDSLFLPPPLLRESSSLTSFAAIDSDGLQPEKLTNLSPSLTAFDAGANFTKDSLEQLMRQCANLRTFKWRFAAGQIDLYLSVIARESKIETLSLEYSSIIGSRLPVDISPLSEMSTLTSLSLRRLSFAQFDSTISKFSKCVNLREIELDDCVRSWLEKNPLPFCLWSFCSLPNLTSLTYNRCGDSTDLYDDEENKFTMSQVLTAFPSSLTHLRLCGFELSHLPDLIRLLPVSLTSLTLSHHLDIELLKSYLALPSLTSFELPDLYSIGSDIDSNTKALRANVNLRHLHVKFPATCYVCILYFCFSMLYF